MVIADHSMANSTTTGRAVLDTVLKQFHSATSAPEIYLRPQAKKAIKNQVLVKHLFDLAKANGQGAGVHNGLGPEELIIDDMDEEQIWQQLELQNETMLPRCVKQTSKLLSAKEDAFKVHFSGDGFESVAEDDSSSGDDEDELEEEEESGSEFASDEDEEDEEEVDEKSAKSAKPKGRPSEVDDQFFKLSEMEEFLEAEDRKEMLKASGKLRRSDEDDLVEIDYFKADDDDDEEGDDGDDDDDEEDYNYANFFGDDRNPEHIHDGDSREVRRTKLSAKNDKKKKSKKQDLGLEDSDIDEEEADQADEDDDDDGGRVKFDLSKNTYRSDSEEDKEPGSEDDDDDDPPPRQFNDSNANEEPEEKSTFEHRQERLRLRIQDMEDQVMGEKSWQLRGEIDSGSRPQNSLLEEVLEFDSTVRPAPVITEETTLQLEDIIRQRIKDKAWNDVERKYKPVNTPQEFRKKLVLDQEKSKASLAQIYEKEYLKEVEKLNPNAEEREADEPKEHQEIRTIMKGLFAQLDALANFSYTPKVAAPEVRIITNTPAIDMEEVAPIAVSDAAMLAPEEVMPRTKGDDIGKSERSDTDKKRERRQKKVKQRQIQAASERKEAERAAKGIVSSDKAEKKKLLDKVVKSRNVTKMKESTDGKSIKSSKQFFSQLQDEVSTVKTAVKSKGKRKTVDASSQANAKKFKL